MSPRSELQLANPVRDALLRAADLIQEEGHYKPGRGYGQCPITALSVDPHALLQDTLRHLGVSLRLHPISDSYSVPIIEWSDSNTKEVVVAALRAAAGEV